MVKCVWIRILFTANDNYGIFSGKDKVIVRFAFSMRPSLLGTSVVNYFSFMNLYGVRLYIIKEYCFGIIMDGARGIVCSETEFLPNRKWENGNEFCFRMTVLNY